MMGQSQQVGTEIRQRLSLTVLPSLPFFFFFFLEE
jgi:hypothetical protein